MATGSVTTAKILDGTILAADFSTGAVDTAAILNGTIVNADVDAAAAIAYSKLALTGSIVNADITNGTINLTTKVTGVLPVANGGTGSAFFTVAGPTATRTYTFPDADTTIGAASAVTGTTLASNVVTSSLTAVGALASGTIASGFGTIYTTSTLSSGITTNRRGPNYIAGEDGAATAIRNQTTNRLFEADGTTLVPLAAGLIVTVKLANTLQAGANTFNYNATGALAIKSHFNVANDIATAYAATGVITLMYDGTRWLDMSQ